MIRSFDGFEWKPLRAALLLSGIANREFEKRKLTRGLTSLASKSPGALMKSEAQDEGSFREALESIGFSDVDIESEVQKVLETPAANTDEDEGEPF